jgi:hypothetical protein
MASAPNCIIRAASAGRGNAAGGEVGHRELASLRDHADEFVRRLVILGRGVEFLVGENGERLHLAGDLAHVLHCVDDIAGTGFALGADHGSAFGDAAESLAEVARAADEGRGEGVLVDVVRLVGRGQDFTLVDEVDAELLQDLGFGEMTDARLGHHRDRNRVDDLLDEFRAGHASHAALGADHGGHALQSHDGNGTGLFGDPCLLHIHDVHDDAALEHFGEADLEAESGAGVGRVVTVLAVVNFCHGGAPGFRCASVR